MSLPPTPVVRLANTIAEQRITKSPDYSGWDLVVTDAAGGTLTVAGVAFETAQTFLTCLHQAVFTDSQVASPARIDVSIDDGVMTEEQARSAVAVVSEHLRDLGFGANKPQEPPAEPDAGVSAPSPQLPPTPPDAGAAATPPFATGGWFSPHGFIPWAACRGEYVIQDPATRRSMTLRATMGSGAVTPPVYEYYIGIA